MRGDLRYPHRFARGRLGRRAAGSYLVAVLVASAATAVRAQSDGVGNAGSGTLDPIWAALVCLTAPLSLTIGLPAGVLIYFFPVGGLLQFPLYGVVLSWLLWRLLRGPRVASPATVEPLHC